MGDFAFRDEALLTTVVNALELGGLSNTKDPQLVRDLVNSAVLAKAARRWAQERVAASQPLIATPVRALTLTNVNFVISPNRVIADTGEDPHHWPHVGKTPEPGIRDLFLVGLRFSRRMNHASALEWARSQTEGSLTGSGAWVRRAHLEVEPYYSGKGESHYPDEGFSLWRHCFGEQGDCYPSAWHDRGRAGKYSMDWVKRLMNADDIWWFVDEDQSTPLR